VAVLPLPSQQRVVIASLNCSFARIQVELEAVRPGEGEGSEEELRLSVAMLPLRLRIDQAVVDFCQVPQQPLYLGAYLW
jgi:hypothetical protein